MKQLLLLFTISLFLLSSILHGQSKNSELLIKKAQEVLYEKPDETIDIALDLLKAEKKTDEVANLYMLLCNAYIAKRDIDSSLYYIMKTTNLINSDALITTKIKILNSVAVQYQQMELYDKSFETLDKAQEYCLKLPPKDTDREFNLEFINGIRGMIYRSQSNPEMALEKFFSAAKYLENQPSTKKVSGNLSVMYYNIGYCYLEMKQYEKAEFYLNESVKISRKSQAKSLEAFALKGLAENEYLKHDYQKSLRLLLLAEVIAEPIGDLTLNNGIYRLLANNYLANNDWEKYQTYNQKLIDTKIEKEKKDLKSLNRYINIQSNENQTKTKDAKTRFNWYQIIIVSLSLITSLWIIKNWLSLKKKNKQLQSKIEDIINPKNIGV